MARERMVTRTVMVTVAEVMCLNVTNAEVQIIKYEMSGTYADTNALLKALKKVYETEEHKLVAVQEVDEKEVLYGMKEVDFIKLATILPPRSSKEVEEQ